MNDDIIFDIETEGAADEILIRAITPQYPPFDLAGVKCGNCRSEEEAQAKIEVARRQHADQEVEYWQEKMEKRALRAETGRVLTIGYLPSSGSDEDVVIDDADGDEARLIRRFWNVYERARANRKLIVGWNSGAGMTVGFDLGFLIKRSWILGVPIPKCVTKGRFVSDTFLDLMQVWTIYGFKEFAKLDHAARVLGIGNKTDQECSGGVFAEWYRAGGEQREKAIYYGKLDLYLTRDIYHRIVPERAPDNV